MGSPPRPHLLVLVCATLCTALGACTFPEDWDGDGYTRASGDCDDLDAAVSPSAEEACNGVDDDCDEVIDGDEAAGAVQWYADSDGDGVGAGESPTGQACAPPAGSVTTGGDCDDEDAAVHPGADELCATVGVDDDCDGDIDEDTFADDAVDQSTWYADGDGDGYGDPAESYTACVAPAGTVSIAGDCHDGDPAVSPDGLERCDGQDNDCDGFVDGEWRVPADYLSIEAAIDAAPDGATICIEPGTYEEDLYISGRTLTLEGALAASEVILASPSSPAVQVLTGSDITLRNLVLRTTSDSGANVLRASFATLQLDAVTVNEVRCTACPVPLNLVQLNDSTVSITDLFIEGNVLQPSPPTAEGALLDLFGPLFSAERTDLDWQGGRVGANTVNLQYFDSANPTVYGLVRLAGGTSTLSDVQIDHNELLSESGTATTFRIGGADLRGVLHVTETLEGDIPTVSLDGVDVTDNEARIVVEPYDIYYDLTYLQLTGIFGFYGHGVVDWSNSALRGNRFTLAIEPAGIDTGLSLLSAGFGLSELDTLRLIGLDISENELTGACDHGLSLYGDVHLEQTSIVGNSITAGALPCSGSGLLSFRSSTAVQAENLIIAQNTCEGGCADGPVSLTSGATARFQYAVLSGNRFTEARAGAFFLGDGTSLTVESCSVDDNEAPLAGAGAIFAEDYASTPPTASIRHSNWFQNGPDAEYAFHLVDGDYADADIDGWEGNQTADPAYVNHSGDASGWDLHLASGSPLIDAGDPAESDADGSRADVGAYGGPGGEW